MHASAGRGRYLIDEDDLLAELHMHTLIILAPNEQWTPSLPLAAVPSPVQGAQSLSQPEQLHSPAISAPTITAPSSSSAPSSDMSDFDSSSAYAAAGAYSFSCVV